VKVGVDDAVEHPVEIVVGYIELTPELKEKKGPAILGVSRRCDALNVAGAAPRSCARCALTLRKRARPIM
jgi:hypothetical protein